jgi:type IV pilus assembly protein PilA
MSNWYFADRLQQRHGPVSADELRAAYQRGELVATSLVWMEGFPNWVPLSSVGAALGIQCFPPGVGGGPQLAYVPAKGMSGCTIALIVCGVGAVPIIAILAAIALPAYQDYVTRAKVSAAVSEIRLVQNSIEEYVEAESKCPSTSDIVFSSIAVNGDSIVESREVDVLPDGRCTIRYQLKGSQFNSGNELSFVRESDGSFNYTGDVPARYLPAALR